MFYETAVANDLTSALFILGLILSGLGGRGAAQTQANITLGDSLNVDYDSETQSDTSYPHSTASIMLSSSRY